MLLDSLDKSILITRGEKLLFQLTFFMKNYHTEKNNQVNKNI